MAIHDDRRAPSAARRAALPLALVAALVPGCSGDSTADRMNVLLITLDTTRPDRMSCYGGQPGLTPTIDAFADDGVRFERAISTAGITPMSHSSILTGLNNYAHGMRVFYSPEVSHRLKDVVDTLPEVLQPLGYRTAARVSSGAAATGSGRGGPRFFSRPQFDSRVWTSSGVSILSWIASRPTRGIGLWVAIVREHRHFSGLH